MSTEKRDQLTGATAIVLPMALQSLKQALDAIYNGKVPEVAAEINEAIGVLEQLIPLFNAASEEARGQG